ncbi:transmembrane protein, putative [Bodo saltans]|uniref:Transmembrane protein, putative n=1 Tax=Bodo saltans TaxID=75058 RepID=A0A0S4J5B8_BODSA|nr:transmembrane protein, putative [Bodo saltans]|eukprot:CUG83170.1 transmembrane protein, putative [Bodo saltans]
MLRRTVSVHRVARHGGIVVIHHTTQWRRTTTPPTVTVTALAYQRCNYSSTNISSSMGPSFTAPPEGAPSTRRDGWFFPSTLLRIAGASAAITLMVACGAVLTWPLMDCFVFPLFFQWAVEASPASLGNVKYSDVPRPADGRPVVVLPLGTGEDDGSSRGCVYLLSGPALSGKSSSIHNSLGDREHIYISCRGFVEGSEVLFGSISSILKPLGLLGGAIMAYNKLFNAMGDFITMNQQHLHITHILLAQNMQFVRHGLTKLREKRHRQQQQHTTEGGTPQRRLPLVILDHYEELIEILRRSPTGSDMTTFPLLLTNFLLRWSIDESLCDVLIVCDDRYVKSQHSSSILNTTQVGCGATSGRHSHFGVTSSSATSSSIGGGAIHSIGVSELGRLVPQLSSRAVHLHMSPTPQHRTAFTTSTSSSTYSSIVIDSTIATIKGLGVAPGVVAACLNAALLLPQEGTNHKKRKSALQHNTSQVEISPPMIVPARIATALSLPLGDVIAACELLCSTGALQCNVGRDVRSSRATTTRHHHHTSPYNTTPPHHDDHLHEWYSTTLDQQAILHLLQHCQSVQLLMETTENKRHVSLRQQVAFKDLLTTSRTTRSWWSSPPRVVLPPAMSLEVKHCSASHQALPSSSADVGQAADSMWVRIRDESSIYSLRNGDVVRTISK